MTAPTDAAAVPTITGGSLAAGDAAAFAETFDTRNAGVSKTLTPAGSVNDGNGGNNYAVTFVTGTLGAIAPCPITVTAAANTKPYDGSTTTAAIPTINAGSLASGDTLAFIETYDTPAVGTGKTLTPSGSVSDGNGGAKYSVTFISNTAGAITQTADHFLVTASPASITAGNNFILVVTAEDVNDTAVANYAGAVQFSSFDGESVAQSVTCTGGVGYTVGTLKKAGTWTVTATDENNSSLSGACTVTGLAGAGLAGRLQPDGRACQHVRSCNAQRGDGRCRGPVWKRRLQRQRRHGQRDPGDRLRSQRRQAAGHHHGGGRRRRGHLQQPLHPPVRQLHLERRVYPAGPAWAADLQPVHRRAGAGHATGVHQPAQPRLQQHGGTGNRTMSSVVVVVEDQYGNTVTGDNSSVTLSLNAAVSGGGGALSGTVTEPASNGVATFSGLSIVNSANSSYGAAGTGYSLTAKDTDAGVVLTPGTSAAFNTTLIVTNVT